MRITKEINGRFYSIESNELYKSQDDNKLNHDELVAKYQDRILSGSINDVYELDGYTININGKTFKGTKEAILSHIESILKPV